jgi:hypothetical protein
MWRRRKSIPLGGTIGNRKQIPLSPMRAVALARDNSREFPYVTL